MLEGSLKPPVIGFGGLRSGDNNQFKSQIGFTGSFQNGFKTFLEAAAYPVTNDRVPDLFTDDDTDVDTFACRTPTQAQEPRVSGFAAAQTPEGAVTL